MNAITILYGSQTGNAEDLAKRIGLQSKQHGFEVVVMAMDDFKLEQLPRDQFICFVCSTTGHGQEPENMKSFYNFIRRRDLPKQCMEKLKFAVFGLGDSSYAKFNCVAKILFKRLEACGAKPVQNITLGDEQHRFGCDGAIYPRLDELWTKITRADISPLDYDSVPPTSSYSLNFIDTAPSALIYDQSYLEKFKVISGTCSMNKRVTSTDHFQDTRLLTFLVQDELDFEPGDVCCIQPANSDINVNQLIDLLGLDADQKIIVRKRDQNFMVDYLYDFIPDGLTVFKLAKHYLDIQSVPRRSFFQFLSYFSDNELERNKLKEFASTEGQEEMYEYCIQPKRTILEVLLDFPGTVSNIKLDYLLDLIPPIKSRSFSIASDIRAHPGEFQLLVGRVEFKTRLRKTRLGLCSNYLSRIGQSDLCIGSDGDSENMTFSFKRTSFKLPKNMCQPIIMIGPGLGIAPFRSFIQSRASTSCIQGQPSMHLYFGCRYKHKDFYFREELERYAADNLIRLRVAYSRETPRSYVQDLIKQDKELMLNLIERQDAVVYVAGNSKLPENIRDVLSEILSDKSNMSVTHLETANKIQYDCW